MTLVMHLRHLSVQHIGDMRQEASNAAASCCKCCLVFESALYDVTATHREQGECEVHQGLTLPIHLQVGGNLLQHEGQHTEVVTQAQALGQLDIHFAAVHDLLTNVHLQGKDACSGRQV